MMPVASFSKIAITDEELDAVQAEAGVSLALNVTVGGVTKLSSISWGDPTGFTGYTSPGYFGFENFTITGNLIEVSGGTMNIDVGSSGTTTRVNMLLPTVTIGGAAGANISAWMKADLTAGLNSANAAEAGIISIRGFSTQVSGTITLYAH